MSDILKYKFKKSAKNITRGDVMRLIKFVLCFLSLTIILIYIFACFFDGVALFADKSISAPVKEIMTVVANTLEVPIFEILAVALPIVLVLFLWRHKLSAMLALLLILAASYAVNIGFPSLTEGKTVEVDVTAEDCERALRSVADKLNELSYANDSASVDYLEYAREYIKKELNVELKNLPKIKGTAFPKLLERWGILGYFAFPTAEIIVCEAQPSFMLPFTAVHELMHYSGVMLEDEANLHAFKILVSSGTPCNEFSAYFAAFTHIGGLLARLDADRYFEIYSALDDEVKECFAERLDFLEKGQGRVKDALENANNAAITARDERGAKSYSYTAHLLVNCILDGNSNMLSE